MLPLPPTELSTANRRPQARPGAYASGNSQALEENLETAETNIGPATTPTRPHTVEPENSGLAVANLVVADETTPQDLPHAQDYNPDNINNNREERMKQFKTKVLLGVIVFLAITIILVAILTPGKKRDNLVPTAVPSEVPSSNPSQGPSSYSEYWLSLFPEPTVSAILEDPESPQLRASSGSWKRMTSYTTLQNKELYNVLYLQCSILPTAKNNGFSLAQPQCS
ncbi:expressed unknown protein [Seminavis robusta]|uniref:Uncharacterized protein n=1 Tax=Seminavis robusta TaxID=568900 RepID=A0A9N8E074_9STRA|nr:expressed unknown protein [Seminavis robusta]|eukprot:Sro519_g159040.1 n/a (225) ;mRNA; f:53361-54035